MTIEVGDLVKVTSPDNVYHGQDFTVLEVGIRGSGLSYRCLRGTMERSRHFRDTDVVKIPTDPKFSPGESVMITRYLYRLGVVSPAVIIGSNNIASIIRLWIPHFQEHRMRYISNRNLRLIK